MRISSLVTFTLAFTLLLSACGEKQSQQENESTRPGQDPTLAKLDEAISAKPDDPELYYERAQYYYERNAYDQALEDVDQAITMDSNKVKYYHLLADTYLDYYKSYQALQVLKTAAERFPDNTLTLLKLSEFQLILKQHKESMRTVDRILKKDPQNAEAYFMFGMNFMETGDTVRAINSFQSAVEFDPDLIDAWILLGQLHGALGNDIATRFFDNAITISGGDVQTMFAKADFLSSQDRLSEAVELYRRIIVKDPQFTTAYFNSGLLYLDMDSLTQARNMFDMAIKTSPAHVESFFYRAVTAEMLGKEEAAKADYEQTLRLAPEFEPARKGLQRLSDPEQ